MNSMNTTLNTYLGTFPRVTLRRIMIRPLVSGRYVRYGWQGGIARVHHTTSATSGVGSSHLLLLLLRRRLLEIKSRYYIWFLNCFEVKFLYFRVLNSRVYISKFVNVFLCWIFFLICKGNIVWNLGGIFFSVTNNWFVHLFKTLE